jgi:hypothetical protein
MDEMTFNCRSDDVFFRRDGSLKFLIRISERVPCREYFNKRESVMLLGLENTSQNDGFKPITHF